MDKAKRLKKKKKMKTAGTERGYGENVTADFIDRAMSNQNALWVL